MNSAALDLETAFKLDIVNVYEGNSFTIALQRFASDGTTNENWGAYDYEFAVSSSASGKSKLISLTSLAGQITRAGNVLKITCLDSENEMKGGITYHYDLVADISAGLTRVEGNGTITVKPSVAK